MYSNNTPIRDDDSVVFKDLAGQRYGDAPAGYDQSVTVLHGCRSIRVAPDSANATFQPFSDDQKPAYSGLSVVLFPSS